MHEPLRSLLEPGWRSLAKGPAQIQWTWALTPGWPTPWPACAEVVYYAFATGRAFPPRIADGVRVAAPWAAVHVGHDGVSRIEPLGHELRELGVQGVRPLSADEVTIHSSADAVDEIVRGLRSPPQGAVATQVSAFFRLWLATHGVLAAELAPHHEPFVAWLAAPR